MGNQSAHSGASVNCDLGWALLSITIGLLIVLAIARDRD